MDFDSLANQHKDVVYRHLLRVCRNREDAEDVLIEALLRAFRNHTRLEDPQAFRAWLSQIGRRICWGLRRREALLPVLELSEHHDPAAREPGPAEIAQQRELKAMLGAAVESLPEEYRRVYQMRDIEEQSGEAVAQALGITLAAMKSRLHRARQLLRKQLDGLLLDEKELK